MLPAWRDTLSHFIVVEPYKDGIAKPLVDKVYTDITENKIQPLRELSPETGAYFNECDSFEPEWQKAFWGANYDRLKKIKKTLDPENVLWCRRCVGSEMLIEQGDGRLCAASHGKRTPRDVLKSDKKGLRRHADGDKPKRDGDGNNKR
jgi:hypothetical protein